MEREKARELLDDVDYLARLTMEGFYQLLLRAGYSEEVAHEAAMERSWNRLSAGEKI